MMRVRTCVPSGAGAVQVQRGGEAAVGTRIDRGPRDVLALAAPRSTPADRCRQGPVIAARSAVFTQRLADSFATRTSISL
jgi:hypothetical protein